MPLDKKFKDVLSLNFGKDDEIHVGLLASSGQFNSGTITLDESILKNTRMITMYSCVMLLLMEMIDY